MDIDDTQEEDETRASLTLCAICHFTLAEPCTLMCGHNFDRRCLRRHLAHAAAHPSCPLCRAPTHPLHLPPVNTMLKALIALSYPDAHLKRTAQFALEDRAAELRCATINKHSIATQANPTSAKCNDNLCV